MNDLNIKRLGNLYSAYQQSHGWQGPKDEASFKNFITSDMAAEKLEMMGVDPKNVDAHFTSERDGKPFKIKYGLSGGPMSSEAVVFEAEGSGGTKQVGFTRGSPRDVDDARYQQLWGGKASAKTSAPGAPPPSSVTVPTT